MVNILNENNGCWNGFYNNVRRDANVSILSCLQINDITVTVNAEKANGLNSQFNSVFNKKSNTHNVIVEDFELNTLALAAKSLRINIAKLQDRNSKSSGDIPAGNLKLGREAIVPYVPYEVYS